MTNVMIVDDELIICQMISRLIDRESLNVNICATVSASDEAYREALKIRPDIIITDINMPMMNGLDLIKNLTDEGLETTYIIISGYQSFDYAYTAIKYGVTDFLLKPIDRDELNNTLKRIIDKKTTIEHTLKQYENMDRLTQNSRQSMRRHLLLGITYPQGNDDLCEQLSDANYFNFTEDTFNICLLNLDVHAEAPQLVRQLLTVISERLEDIVVPVCHEFEATLLGESLIFVLNYSGNQRDEMKIRLSNILSFAIERVREYQLSVTISISREQRNSRCLCVAYHEALYAMRSRYVLGQNRIIYAEECNIGPTAPFMGLADLKPDLARQIEVLDFDGTKETLYALINAIHEYLHVCPYNTPSLYNRILRELLSLIREFHRTSNDEYTDAKAIKKCFDKCYTLAEFDSVLEKHFSERYNAFAEDSQRSQNQAITLVKRYIAENYAQPLTLETLANHVHLNTTYLGILFKKNEGVNFTDYFLNVRIEKAKQMLRDTGESIQSIANGVGYSDTRYFSKLFQRVVGVKPSEYRKIHVY